MINGLNICQNQDCDSFNATIYSSASLRQHRCPNTFNALEGYPKWIERKIIFPSQKMDAVVVRNPAQLLLTLIFVLQVS